MPPLRPVLTRHILPLLPRRTHTTHTVDPTEVTHFNALAADWWDPHGSSRLLHLMNPLRLQFLQRCLLIGSPVTPSGPARTTPSKDSISAVQGSSKLRYMDVGCGGGILAESLARLGSTQSVVGIDPTPQVLAVARAHARRDPALKGRLEYRETTVDQVPRGEVFDVVTTMEVVEHVPDPYVFLRECMRHVRPGGWVVGSTIARTWTSWVTTKLVAEDLLGIVPRGTHDWEKYVNAEELRTFFEQDGWEKAVFSGCFYVPGVGWREIDGGEKVGNYFFGVRRSITGN